MTTPSHPPDAYPAEAALPFPPLIPAVFLERLNRFVALVETAEGEVVTAHVPTTGRMGELLLPGAAVYLAPAGRPGRATAYDLVLAEADGGRRRPEVIERRGAPRFEIAPPLVCIDSRVPNRLLARHWSASPGPCGGPVLALRPEPRHDGGRFDFVVEDAQGAMLVEVKSVTLVRDGIALFPDAPTERGARHLRGLAARARAGERAAAVFMVQREDAVAVSPNTATDPSFAEALADAGAAGVLLLAFRCRVTPHQIAVAAPVPVLVT